MKNWKYKWLRQLDMWLKVSNWIRSLGAEILNLSGCEKCIDSRNSDGLVQDCSNSSALAMELLQACTKPLIWSCFSRSLTFITIPEELELNMSRNEVTKSGIYRKQVVKAAADDIWCDTTRIVIVKWKRLATEILNRSGDETCNGNWNMKLFFSLVA